MVEIIFITFNYCSKYHYLKNRLTLSLFIIFILLKYFNEREEVKNNSSTLEHMSSTTSKYRIQITIYIADLNFYKTRLNNTLRKRIHFYRVITSSTRYTLALSYKLTKAVTLRTRRKSDTFVRNSVKTASV